MRDEREDDLALDEALSAGEAAGQALWCWGWLDGHGGTMGG